jgi:hypothetical protein
VHENKNRTMKPVEIVLRREKSREIRENDGRGESN